MITGSHLACIRTDRCNFDQHRPSLQRRRIIKSILLALVHRAFLRLAYNINGPLPRLSLSLSLSLSVCLSLMRARVTRLDDTSSIVCSRNTIVLSKL